MASDGYYSFIFQYHNNLIEFNYTYFFINYMEGCTIFNIIIARLKSAFYLHSYFLVIKSYIKDKFGFITS